MNVEAHVDRNASLHGEAIEHRDDAMGSDRRSPNTPVEADGIEFVASAVYGPDGDVIVTARADGAVVWTVESADLLSPRAFSAAPWNSADLNSSGTRMITVGRDSVVVWDLENFDRTVSLSSVPVTSTTFGQFGVRTLLVDGDGVVIRGLDPGSGNRSVATQIQNPVSAAFSSDGTRAAIAGNE